MATRRVSTANASGSGVPWGSRDMRTTSAALFIGGNSLHNVPQPVYPNRRPDDSDLLALPGNNGNLQQIEVTASTTQPKRDSAHPSSRARESDHQGHKGSPDEWEYEDTFLDELLPNESYSVVHLDTHKGVAVNEPAETCSALSANDWKVSAKQIFSSKDNFQQNICSWSSKIHGSILPNTEDLEAWQQNDVEWDPETGGMFHPPSAPQVHRDRSLLNDIAMDMRRASQTPNAVCTKFERFSAVEKWQTADVLREGHETRSAPYRIRWANDKDIGDMRTIYNEEVVKGTQALDSEPVSPEDFNKLLQATGSTGMPMVVAVRDHTAGERILAFGYLTKYNLGLGSSNSGAAQAYIFVAFNNRNQGIGCELLNALLRVTFESYAPSKQFHAFCDFASISSNTPHNRKLDPEHPNSGALLPSLVAQTQLHCVVVEVLNGVEGGLAERQYDRVLTQTFGFEGPETTEFWSPVPSGGHSVKKKLVYVYDCGKGGRRAQKPGGQRQLEDFMHMATSQDTIFPLEVGNGTEMVPVHAGMMTPVCARQIPSEGADFRGQTQEMTPASSVFW